MLVQRRAPVQQSSVHGRPPISCHPHLLSARGGWQRQPVTASCQVKMTCVTSKAGVGPKHLEVNRGWSLLHCILDSNRAHSFGGPLTEVNE